MGDARAVRTWLRDARAFARIGVGQRLAYRATVAFVALRGLFPLLLALVWLTVVDTSGPPAGWTATRLATYYFVVAVVDIVATSEASWTWDDDIRSGEINAKLLRPAPVFVQYTAIEAGRNAAGAIVMAPAAVLLAVLVPAISLPNDAGRLTGAVLATVLAAAVSATMTSAIALIGLWTTQSTNIYLLWWGLGSFFSGLVAPLALMPPWLRATATVLPFRYTLGLPAEIVTGRLSVPAVIAAFATGLGWLAAFGLAYRVLWRRGIRRFQAVGG